MTHALLRWADQLAECADDTAAVRFLEARGVHSTHQTYVIISPFQNNERHTSECSNFPLARIHSTIDKSIDEMRFILRHVQNEAKQK